MPKASFGASGGIESSCRQVVSRAMITSLIFFDIIITAQQCEQRHAFVISNNINKKTGCRWSYDIPPSKVTYMAI